MHRMGIDLGGTKIEGILLDPKGKELLRHRIPTEREKGYEAILQKIKSLHDLAVSKVGSHRYTFGIGTPGGISRRTGLLSLSNTVCMNGKPVKADIEKLLDRPVAVENDANCFAMAEAKMGAGRGYESVFGVIMGTGCGGGIVHKGEVVIGHHTRGGEWGHHAIDPNGPLCFCGRRGCAETFISGGGLERMYEHEYKTRRALRDIEADYAKGEARAVAFMQNFFAHFGMAMANLITILDPDIIVLGGGVSNFKDIYTKGVAEVRKCILGDELETPIVQHQLGDSAGVIGAALIGI